MFDAIPVSFLAKTAQMGQNAGMGAVASNVVPSNRLGPRYQPLVILAAAVAAGILFDRFCPLPLAAWWTLAVGGVLSWVALTVLRCGAIVGYVLLLAAVAAAAGGWHHCQWRLFADDDLARYARDRSQPVCIDVLAMNEPRMVPPPAPDPMLARTQNECWRFEVEAVALRNGRSWQPVSGCAALLVEGEPPDVAVGDRIRCLARLQSLPRVTNPGQRDRAAFFRSRRVLCRLQAESAECLAVIEQGSPWTASLWLGRLRSYGHRTLQQYLAPQQAELAAAVLLGFREELDGARNEAFLTTGTVHILSISGLHVGILALALFALMRCVPMRRGLGLVVVAAITSLYAVMVDAEPPVVRATVIVLVTCLAKFQGYRALGMNTLAAAAIVVLAMNPSDLFNVGAQLSFLCVAGLIWFASRRPDAGDDLETAQRSLDRLIAQNQGPVERAAHGLSRWVVGLALAGVLIWLLTLPLVMARFHIVSPVAIGLNALLWLPMTFSVLSGFGILVLGPICWPLGYAFGGVCNVSFYVLEWIIDAAHRCPYGHFWLPGPPDWWLWGFYGGLGLLLAFPRLRPSWRWRVAMLFGWIAVGVVPAVWPHDRDRLDCTFLDVGHGCAVLLELPSGRTMLYDAGRLGSPTAGARTISECLWDRNIRRLDAVVLSHPDADHYNALPGLLKKFSVGRVFVSPVMFAKETRTLRVLRNAIDEHGAMLREVRAGDHLFDDEDCGLEVLHPPLQPIEGHDNASSLVLAVAYRGRRILLPGDLESPGLERLLAEKPVRCAVLLAPHHGSRKSNSPELAAWCSAENVVFSGDGRWSLAETEAPYCAAGGRVFHTHFGGAIHVQIDADGVQVWPFVQESER